MITEKFRDNLIIDKYDPILNSYDEKKLKYFESINSEDVLTWNTFRSLRQINPHIWLNNIFNICFKRKIQLNCNFIKLSLWKKYSPPLGIREYQNDEGASEIDIVFETNELLWFIEAKYKSDISKKTKSNLLRDQLLRNIDLGSWHAGVRDFYFSFLYWGGKEPKAGLDLINKYSNSQEDILAKLPHRKKDKLSNLKGIGSIKWEDIVKIFNEIKRIGNNNDLDKVIINNYLNWINSRNISNK